MRDIKIRQQHRSGKWLLVVAFILALIPFSSQLSSISGQRISAVTELVAVKKIQSKRIVFFESASLGKVIHEGPLGSLSVIARLSVLHGNDTKRIKEHRHYLDGIHRERCCQPKTISSSDEDPFLLS
jgi:hypothetical protein